MRNFVSFITFLPNGSSQLNNLKSKTLILNLRDLIKPPTYLNSDTAAAGLINMLIPQTFVKKVTDSDLDK